jgi:hypothetical protein
MPATKEPNRVEAASAFEELTVAELERLVDLPGWAMKSRQSTESYSGEIK